MGRVNHSKGTTRQRAHFFDGRNPTKPEPARNVRVCHVKGCGQVTNGHMVPGPDDSWLDVCGWCLDVITGRRAAR